MIHPSATATEKTKVKQPSAKNQGDMNKSICTMIQRNHHQFSFPHFLSFLFQTFLSAFNSYVNTVWSASFFFLSSPKSDSSIYNFLPSSQIVGF